MTYLNQYIERRNAFAKIFGKPAINLKSITKAQIESLMDDLEGELSPENLTCDGELRGAILVRKANSLKGAYSELETLYKKFA